jgi:peroxiredoxin Q/BCP
MSKLNIGDKAPDFSLQVSGKQNITLADFKDKTFVLYFYPKDDTPGCTIEAQDFNERLQDFKAKNIEVVGVSRDSVESHDKFCNKYGLKITLASDTGGHACESYGVLVEKSMFGKKYMGINRSTFLIDKAGKIADIWWNVSVGGHVLEVLKKAGEI